MSENSPENDDKRYYPQEENIGLPCQYWLLAGGRFVGCNYPKAGLEGRLTCAGFIDSYCIYVISGKLPKGASIDELYKLKTQPPTVERARNIPPGNDKI